MKKEYTPSNGTRNRIAGLVALVLALEPAIAESHTIVRASRITPISSLDFKPTLLPIYVPIMPVASLSPSIYTTLDPQQEYGDKIFPFYNHLKIPTFKISPLPPRFDENLRKLYSNLVDHTNPPLPISPSYYGHFLSQYRPATNVTPYERPFGAIGRTILTETILKDVERTISEEKGLVSRTSTILGRVAEVTTKARSFWSNLMMVGITLGFDTVQRYFQQNKSVPSTYSSTPFRALHYEPAAQDWHYYSSTPSCYYSPKKINKDIIPVCPKVCKVIEMCSTRLSICKIE